MWGLKQQQTQHQYKKHHQQELQREYQKENQEYLPEHHQHKQNGRQFYI